jgi:hypothetical protein
MNNKLLMLGGLVPILVLLALPYVYAEGDSKRARDGFTDGSNAARDIYKMVISLIQSAIILATDNIQRFIVMHGTSLISAYIPAASPKCRTRWKWPAK